MTCCVFVRGHLFCSRNDLTCQPCQCVALLSSMVGRMLPCGWQQTQTVYFVCTGKRLRLGSPFLFSQWKGEIDGYHLCGIALFERYQTFHRHHWILSWANKHTNTHSNRVFHFVLNFLFALRQRGGGVFSCAHLRHSCWLMCNHAFLIQWFKCISEQTIKKTCVLIGHNSKFRAVSYLVITSWEEFSSSEELLASSYEC